MGIRSVISKYAAVVIIPTFCFSAIYADYSHTQKWKREKVVKQQSALL